MCFIIIITSISRKQEAAQTMISRSVYMCIFVSSKKSLQKSEPLVRVLKAVESGEGPGIRRAGAELGISYRPEGTALI